MCFCKNGAYNFISFSFLFTTLARKRHYFSYTIWQLEKSWINTHNRLICGGILRPFKEYTSGAIQPTTWSLVQGSLVWNHHSAVRSARRHHFGTLSLNRFRFEAWSGEPEGRDLTAHVNGVVASDVAQVRHFWSPGWSPKLEAFERHS